jgi:hypothetical protein
MTVLEHIRLAAVVFGGWAIVLSIPWAVVDYALRRMEKK